MIEKFLSVQDTLFICMTIGVLIKLLQLKLGQKVFNKEYKAE